MLKVITTFPVNTPECSGHWIIEGVTDAGYDHVGNVCERGEHKKDPAKALLDMAVDKEADLVIVTKSHLYEKALKKLECKKVMMNVDCRIHIYSWKHLFPSIEACDAYFVCENHLIPEYKKRFGDKVYFLPTACGRTANFKLERKGVSTSDVNRYSADISFIGARDKFHGEHRGKIISAIEGKYRGRFKWYGPGSPHGYASRDAFNKICNLSKIMIGCNYMGKFDSYVSRRDFMIIGSGGFLVTNLVKNSRKIMTPKKHYVPYQTPEECLKVVNFYLQRPDLREQIRAEAYKYAHEKCRWANRIEEIVKTVGVK